MDPTPDGAARNEVALWRSLIARALRSGVAYEDAQDLASEAIRKALEAHVPERGPFAPFCRTIHANLLKNHWRDRKPIEEFDPETDEREGSSDPLEEIVSQEERDMMRRIADRILATLDPAEAAFFLALADVHREAEKAAVTAAARRLGIEPLKGWNLFRRIQRKAREHVEEYQSTVEIQGAHLVPEEAPETPRMMEPIDDEMVLGMSRPAAPKSEGLRPAAGDWWLLVAAGAATAGYERFAASLGAKDRGRLSALLI